MIAPPPWLSLSVLLLAGCGLLGPSADRAAQDRIMLVREESPTLGYQRLIDYSRAHPDLAAFLRLRGKPDFLAETSAGPRSYLVLYDLSRREAHVCRVWRDEPDSIEFSGPYSITNREIQALQAMRQSSLGPG
jgi:hypothetical protein